jgi:prolyl oligopeptidase
MLMATVLGIAFAGEPEDPYLWLEDVEGEKALDWVRARNAVSQGELEAAPGFEALQARLLEILDSKEQIVWPTERDGWWYNFWKDGDHPRGIWRRTTPEDYRRPEPNWEVLLDVDALGKQENVNWVWHGADCLPPTYERCLVSLSRGGSDADVVREFDVNTRRFVEGGFSLPEAKGGASWVDLDHVYVSTDFGPGSMTTSGYPRQVKEWERGAPLSGATVVYEGKEADVSAFGWRDHSEGYVRDVFGRSPTFFSNELYLRKGKKLVRIDKPDDANAGMWRDWLIIELRSAWEVDGTTWPAGALLATDLDDFIKGKREIAMLFTPTERTALSGWTATKSHLVVTTLDNVRSRLTVHTPGKGGWTAEPLAGVPEFGTVSVSAVDPDHDDRYFLTVTDFLTPTGLYLGEIGGGPPALLDQLPAYFDASTYEVSQHEATSDDGTKIPYFQVAKKGLVLDGTSPTLLSGYGGFEVSHLPAYSASVGIGWLDKGGVYVVGNIRGGGEFGPRWHQAALKENRPRAYEDFAAVARDLIARKVTSPAHLGIQGGSNGGLLMGNMLVRTPELFGAIVCQVPLLDMKRYTHLLAGASWMGEYGDPDKPEEWAFIQKFSPYQLVTKDAVYPRVLFTTSTRDDRVHPGHARKMAAKMLDEGHDLLYYENIEGGHGGAADNKQAAHMWALTYTFLWNELTKPAASTP